MDGCWYRDVALVKQTQFSEVRESERAVEFFHGMQNTV